MRKGFSLIELLVIVTILPFILIVIDGLFSSMLSDVPRSWNTMQNNSTLLNMLQQMEQDIDAAQDLPLSIDGYTADDKLLLIERTNQVIHYQLKNDRVFRYGFADNQNIAELTRSWSLPKTIIQWRVLRQNGKGYAVEIQHHIEYTLRGHLIKKMENSNMFFIGVFE
jgi:type II secretory pathway component PulJ